MAGFADAPPITDFYDPGAASGASWWGRNAPEALGGVPSGYGDTDYTMSGQDVAGLFGGAAKAMAPGTPAAAGGGSGQPPAASAPAVGRPSTTGQLDKLLQLLMQRQQAYQAAAVPGGGIVAQNARTQQPGLLGM